jgi:hypothetical protein
MPEVGTKGRRRRSIRTAESRETSLTSFLETRVKQAQCRIEMATLLNLGVECSWELTMFRAARVED